MRIRKLRFDLRSIAVALALLAAGTEPGEAIAGSESFGTWSDRFATHDAIVNPVVTGALLAVGGESVYSGSYRLEDGRWVALGEMTGVEIIATTVSGTDVFVSGYSNDEGPGTFVAHWNGTAWTTIARNLNERVWAMTVHDGDLYVAGWFSSGENFTARYVARWDGSSWTQIGDEPPAAMAIAFVGDTLHVGGGSPTGYVSVWTGSEWKRIGYADARVEVLYALGNDLYAGGRFQRMHNGQATAGIDARRIAKWNGLEWTPLGEGLGNSLSPENSGHFVSSMTALGSDLVVGGRFVRAGSPSGIARWDGERWSGFGSGSPDEIHSVASRGDELYVAGFGLEQVDGATVIGYARWNGSSWSPIGDRGNSIENVLSLRGRDGVLYAGGYFRTAGGAKADFVAKWDGVAWSEIGGGTDDWVYTLAFHGDDLFAGGRFEHAGGHAAPHVARWNGTDWSALGDGPGGTVFELLFVGDELYACGTNLAAPYPQPSFVARWDGSAWTTLATVGGVPRAMAFFDGALYVGGNFYEIGGVAARGIARLNGDTWEALPPGFNRDVNELEVVDGELWAVGSFYDVDEFPFYAAAIWTGDEWISAQAPFFIEEMETVGDNIYLGGQDLLRRDGDGWATVTNAYAARLAALGTQLYLTGFFDEIDGTPSHNIGSLATGDCGNGVLDEGEQCDPAIEGTGGCCNMNDCSIAASETVCRPFRGPCDVAETCDGTTTICPDDAIAESGASCSNDTDACAGPGQCDGDGISCPDEPCNDRNACNGEETCGQNGTCSDGVGLDCDDDLACTTDSCAADEGCIHEWTPGNGCAECGDVNEDGEINGTDALTSLRGAVGIVTCPLYLCDYDGNRKLSAGDSLRILRVSVGIDIAPQCPTTVE